MGLLNINLDKSKKAVVINFKIGISGDFFCSENSF